MERRKFFKAVGLMTAAAYISPKVFGNEQGTVKTSSLEGVPPAEFPPLPFAYNALEPHIDARTMEIHYDKHHRAYYTNFMNAVKGTPLEGKPLSEIFAGMSKLSETMAEAITTIYFSGKTWEQDQQVPQVSFQQLSQRPLAPLTSLRKLSPPQLKQGLEADGHGCTLALTRI